MTGIFGKNPGSVSYQGRLMILFAFIIGICLVGVLSSDGADAADGEEFTIEGIEYQIVSETNKTVKITDYTGSATELTIPANVTNGSVEYSVISIGNNAFRGCNSLTSVTLPNSVTTIGNYAFGDCRSLTSVTIPNSVTTIGNYAFYYCKSLTSVTIPNSVTSIGDYAFYECSALTSIAIPSGVESIGDYAFCGCTALSGINVSNENLFYKSDDKGVLFTEDGKELLQCPGGKSGSYEIPSGVESIGVYAFYGCSALTSITIPDSVTSIGDRAFYGCSSLTSIAIPSGVTSIEDYAFYECSALTSVIIPNNVTSIGNRAFYGCSSLTSITIPDSVTSIGDSAFNRCSSLTSVTIPNNVTSIGDYTFYGCSSLASVTMPNGVTSIGGGAFQGCSSLTSVTIPNNVTSIGDYAFYGCRSLTSITIPNGVTSIGILAFYGCTALSGIYVSDNNPNYMSDDEGVLFTEDGKVLIQCPGGKSGSYEIPSGVESIEDYAFYGCSALISITIPDSVTSIGYSSFEGCDSLTSIAIPSGVTSIGTYAFYECSALTSITIPKSVTSIGDYAFYGCSALTGINVSNENPNYMSDDEGVLFTEDGKVLIQCPGGKSGSYEIPSGVESIGDYAFCLCSALTSITIPKSVTSIGEGAFEGCDSLTSITIPSGVESIGDYAFYECSALTSITIPDSVTSIGDYAFDGCIALVEFDVSDDNPNYKSDDEGILFNKSGTSLIKYPGGKSGTYTILSEVTIEDHAFYGCVKLTAIYVEDNDLYSSDSGVLFNEDGTELICYPGGKEGPYTIPANVIEINDYAFRYCYGLTSLTVNWSNEYGIYDIVCLECPNVTEIIVLGNDNLKSIDGSIYRVHENGLSLIRCPEGKTSLVLPESVVSISSDAVFLCHGLKEVIIKEGDSLDISQYAFMQSNPDFIFKSGKDGFDLKAYVDESKTIEVTGAMLSSGWVGTLHFDWIPISEDPSDNPSDEPSGGINIGIVIGGIVAVIAVAGVGVFLFMRSRP